MLYSTRDWNHSEVGSFFQVGSVIRNPEIAALVPTLLISIADPNEHTKTSLDLLLQVGFQIRGSAFDPCAMNE